MKIHIDTPAGMYTTPEGSVRKLEHEFGPIYVIDEMFEAPFVKGLGAVLARLPFTASDYDTEESRHILHMKCELPAAALIAADLQNEALLGLLPKPWALRTCPGLQGLSREPWPSVIPTIPISR